MGKLLETKLDIDGMPVCIRWSNVVAIRKICPSKTRVYVSSGEDFIVCYPYDDAYNNFRCYVEQTLSS